MRNKRRGAWLPAVVWALFLGTVTIVAVQDGGGFPSHPAPRARVGGGEGGSPMVDSPSIPPTRVTPGFQPPDPRAPDEEAIEPAISPRTEKQHRERFAALLRHDPALFEKLAVETLAGDGPDCEKVALLRAAYEGDSKRAIELFEVALQELPAAPPVGRVSVPAFVVRYLGERSARDPAAWRALERAVWPDTGTMAPELRRRAAVHLLKEAPPNDLWRLRQQLAREQDVALLQSAAAALALNPYPDTARLMAQDLGLEVKPVNPPDLAKGEE